MSLAMIPASAVTNLTGEYTFTTSTDPYGILVLNNNTASGAFGVQANSYSGAGSGIYGYSDVASGAVGYGVAGISQTGYGVYGSSYGAGISAIYAENLGTGGGIGMQGTSAYGTGVNAVGAQNGLVGESNATSGVWAGVYGYDNSSGSGAAYGVEGSSAIGTDPAVAAFQSASGSAVYASASSGAGVAAYSSSGAGAFTFSSSADSIDSNTGGSGGEAVIGAATGEGVEAIGFSGTATDPGLSIDVSNVSGTDSFHSFNSGGTTFEIQAGSAFSSGGTQYDNATDVQIAGDVYVSGAVYTDCIGGGYPSPAGNCGSETYAAQRSANGAKLKTYAAEQSTKTIEDLGEAQVVNGEGHVALDPTFASAIARDRSYLVFLTPEGDSRGLYVTSKTLAGFAVRESSGGHSSLAVAYRIVAHPYGDSGVRMAAIVSQKTAGTGFATQRISKRALKAKIVRRHASSIGARVTRPPQIWVKNMHRNI